MFVGVGGGFSVARPTSFDVYTLINFLLHTERGVKITAMRTSDHQHRRTEDSRSEGDASRSRRRIKIGGNPQ